MRPVRRQAVGSRASSPSSFPHVRRRLLHLLEALDADSPSPLLERSQSPLFATLQYLSAKPLPAAEPLPPFKPDTFLEDVAPLLPSSTSPPADPAARRSFFSKADARRATPLEPSHLVRGDFSHGFLAFDNLSLALPGGLKFKLDKYWNGEPVVFSCQRRAEPGNEAETFFVVTFELEADEGGALPAGAQGAGEAEAEAKEEVSEDVD